jgi:RNA polymerase sigma-70 factor, ECF subfamily
VVAAGAAVTRYGSSLVTSVPSLTEAELCARFLPLVRVFAARRFRTNADVEDFSQEVVSALLVAHRAGKLRNVGSLGGFILGMCRNLANAWVRSATRRDVREAKTLAQLVSDDLETGLVQRWLLEHCLMALTTRSLKVVHASFCEDRDAAEIAAALSLSRENVRVLRHRAVAQLRECMDATARDLK